jgi:hypothetical protein
METIWKKTRIWNSRQSRRSQIRRILVQRSPKPKVAISTTANYCGDWNDSKAYGQGVLVITEKETGKIIIHEGAGNKYYNYATSYKGIYRNGSKNGKGEFIWHDASNYNGDFLKGAISRQGVLHWNWNDGRLTKAHGSFKRRDKVVDDSKYQ